MSFVGDQPRSLLALMALHLELAYMNFGVSIASCGKRPEV